MSLEQKVEELTQAIKSLPAELAGILNSGVAASARPEEQPKVEQATQQHGSDQSVKEEGGEAEKTIAGRKTYVWDKKAKQGQIIEKGEEVPTGDDLQTVGKTNWEKLCAKYELDPATGQAAEKPEQEEDDDLGDLDDAAEETSNAVEEDEDTDGGDDLDDDLGLDDDDDAEAGGVSKDDVKQQMVNVMKTCGREIALKVFKKFGARNLEEVKPEDYQAIYDLAGKQLDKAGK
ncbi:hypothetical protein [Marinobacter nauticus]|uniref:Uncharacterized protein n=1 Tax=Marinobacter nauticus TaxID=2743 RepID=A0A833JR43_MARNT|nr:hypothetical protein [Marinobacter nauticus]KAE8546163.1 hypothetical protein F6453_1409 [Marinobacter nauticus]